MENTRQNSLIRNTIGTITIGSGFFPIKVYIGERPTGFTAACEISGSVWFETAETGIAALLQLAERIENRSQVSKDFDLRMFEHLGQPMRSCADSSCVYCGTWADHVRSEEMAEAAGA